MCKFALADPEGTKVTDPEPIRKTSATVMTMSRVTSALDYQVLCLPLARDLGAIRS